MFKLTAIYLLCMGLLCGKALASSRQESAIDFFINGEYQKALTLLNRDLAENPEQFYSYETLGICYDYLEQYDQALPLFLKALALNPDKIDLNLRVGNIYYEQDKFAEAVTYFKKTLALDPKKKGVNESIGYSLTNLNQTLEAIPYLIEALKEKTDDASLNGIIGNNYLINNKDEQAEPYLRTSIRLDPKAPFPRLDLGTLLASRGELKEARAVLEKAKELFDALANTRWSQYVQSQLDEFPGK